MGIGLANVTWRTLARGRENFRYQEVDPSKPVSPAQFLDFVHSIVALNTEVHMPAQDVRFQTATMSAAQTRLMLPPSAEQPLVVVDYDRHPRTPRGIKPAHSGVEVTHFSTATAEGAELSELANVQYEPSLVAAAASRAALTVHYRNEEHGFRVHDEPYDEFWQYTEQDVAQWAVLGQIAADIKQVVS